MILEKIRQYIQKILFFVTGVLLLMSGLFFNRQKQLEQVNDKNIALKQAQAAEALSAQVNMQIASFEAMQNTIVSDRQQKLDSIADNPTMVVRQETVPVTKIIPGATRKVTVSASSSSSSSKKTTTKTTTKAAPAPATSTKTS